MKLHGMEKVISSGIVPNIMRSLVLEGKELEVLFVTPYYVNGYTSGTLDTDSGMRIRVCSGRDVDQQERTLVELRRDVRARGMSIAGKNVHQLEGVIAYDDLQRILPEEDTLQTALVFVYVDHPTLKQTSELITRLALLGTTVIPVICTCRAMDIPFFERFQHVIVSKDCGGAMMMRNLIALVDDSFSPKS